MLKDNFNHSKEFILGFERCEYDFQHRETDKDFILINPYRAGTDEFDGYESAIEMFEAK